MDVRPYLVLGEADRGFLRERIAAALAAWREEWLAPGAPEPRLLPAAQPSAERWLCGAAGAGRRVALGYPGSWIAEAGALIALHRPRPGVAAPGAELAAQIGEALLKALAVQVLRACLPAEATQPGWDSEAPPDGWLAPGAGATIHQCELSPVVPLIIALSPKLVAASLPGARAAAGARAPLVGMARALEPCPVQLEAVVGEAEIELGELSQLAAGDVIVLDRKLDDPLLLRLDIGKAVGRAHLGTAGASKAVQVAGPAST